MNAIATATETTTVVRIGKGLTFHAQLQGVEGPAAACGTVSRTFGAERHVQGTVSCRKCLDAIAADEAREAAEAEEVHAALLLEDAAAEIAAEVEVRRYAEPIEFTPEVIAEAMADIDRHNEEVAARAAATEEVTFEKGEVVTLIADGQGWTVRRVLKDGTLRLINEDGKKINRKPSAVTK